MALHYLGIDYQDDVMGANWGDLKFNSGLDFPNLPYYIGKNTYIISKQSPKFIISSFVSLINRASNASFFLIIHLKLISLFS